MSLGTLSTILMMALVAGCGGKGHSVSNDDMAMVLVGDDMTATPSDLGQACTALMFPDDSGSLFAIETDDPSSGLDWADQLGSIEQGSTPNLLDTMVYEYWHTDGDSEPSLPHAATFSSATRLATCSDCLTINVDATSPDDLDSGTLYLAQAGSINATHLDHGPSGTIAVSGSGLRFIEWTQDDKPVPDGRCIDVASFDWSATYTNGAPGDM